MNEKHKKQYLADGLYAQYRDGQIELSAEDGTGKASNTVYLDSTTLLAFGDYLLRNFDIELKMKKTEP